jgi:hypothetical protein
MIKLIIIALIIGLGILSAPIRLIAWWINTAMIKLKRLYEAISS